MTFVNGKKGDIVHHKKREGGEESVVSVFIVGWDI